MTKKGKRTALLQQTGEIADLRKENELLRSQLAAGQKGEASGRPGQEAAAPFPTPGVDAFIICDSNLVVVDVDDAALRYLGPARRREDVIGKDLPALVPDKKRCDQYVRAMQSGERFVAEETLVLPDAGQVHVITRAFRVGDRLAILTSDVTGEVRAREELLESEGRLRQITDNMLDAVSLLDKEGNVLYASPSHERILGYRPEELLGKAALDLTHPEDVAEAGITAALAATGEGEGSRFRYRFRHRDGHYVWGEASAKALRDDKGDITGYVIASRDITERQRAEEKLREEEERYRLLADNASDVIWLADADFNLTYVSPSAARVLHLRSDEMATPAARDLLIPDVVRARVEALRRPVPGPDARRPPPAQRDLTIELRLQLRDRSTVWVEVNVNLIHDAGGRPAGIMGITREVTDRREAQEELRASEERSRLLIENANEGIAVIQDGVLKFANRKLAEASGYSREELASRPLAQLIHPDDVPSVMDQYARRLKGEHLPSVSQVRFVGKADNTTLGEVNAVLFEWDGRPAVLALISDITEREAARLQLEESEQKYRALADRSIQGIIVVQGDPPRVVYSNAALAEMAGYTVEEMLALSPQKTVELIHPEDRDLFFRHFRDRLQGQPIEPRYQVRGVRKDGTVVWLEVFASAIEYRNQPAVQAVFVDITDRKQAEERLRESEEKFSAAFRLSPVAIVLSDLEDGRYVEISDRTGDLSGYAKEEAIGRTATEMGIWPNAEDRQKMVAILMEKGRVIDQEVTMRDRRGRLHTVSLSAEVITLRGKRYLLSISNDVTERRRAEETAARQRDLAHRLSAVSDLHEGLRICLEAAMQTAEMDSGGIYLAEGLPGGLRLMVHEGLSEEFVRTVSYYAPDSPNARLLSSGAAMYGRCADLGALARGVGEQEGLKAVAALPFLHEGCVLGFINLASHTLEEVPLPVREPLEIIGVQVGGAIARLRAEAALRESEERYRMVFESSPVAIWEEDFSRVKAYMDGLRAEGVPDIDDYFNLHPEEVARCAQMAEIIDVNQAALELHGARTKEDLLAGLLTTFTPESFAAFRQELVCLWNGGTRMTGDATVKTLAGQPRDVTVSFSVAPGFETTLSRVLVSLNDITERKQAENDLHRQERFFRALLDNSADGILVVTTENTVQYASPGAMRLLGYTGDRSGAGVLDPIVPEDLPAAGEAFRKALSGTPGRAELRCRHQNGSIRTIDSSLVNLLDDPAVGGIVVNMRDITDRRLAEEEARRKTEELDEFFNVALDLMCVADTDARFHLLNPAWESTLGYTHEELTAVPFIDFVHPEDVKATVAALARLASGQDVVGLINRYRCRDGTYRVLEWRYSPAGDLIYGAGRDITERRRAQDQLQRQERFFRAVTENSTDGILVADREGNVTYETPGALRLLGLSSPRTGQPVAGPIHPDDLAAAAEVLGDVRAGKPARAEMRARHTDGSWRTIDSSLVNLLDDPAVQGIVVNMRDITERKQAEQTIAESERKFRTLFDSASDAIFIHGEAGPMLEVNQVASRRLGYTREELLGMTPADIDTPEYAASVPERIRQITQQGQAIFETAHVTKDGRVVPTEISARTMVFEGQTAVLTIARDITDRKRAEEELRRQEELFRAITENASDLIVLVGLDGMIRYESPAAERLLGFSPEERVGVKMLERLHPDDIAFCVESFKRQVADARAPASSVEVRLRHKDGSWVQVEAVASVIARGAAVEGLVVNIRDIGERKRAEESLRASEEKYRGIFDDNIVPIYVFDHEKRFVDTNQAGCDLLGYTREELLRLSIPDVDADPVIVLPAHGELLSGGRLINYEHRLRRKDGTIITVLNNSRPLTDATGRVTGMQSTLLDITQRKKMEDALKENEARYRGLFESTQTGMEVLNMETGLVELANEAAAKIFGFDSPDEMVGIDSTKFVREEDLAWVARGIAEGPKEPRDVMELRVRTRDGRWLWVNALTSRTVYQGNAALVSSMLDITERKRSEEELKHSEERLALALDAASAGMFDWNMISGEMHFSDRFYRMLGYDAGEVPASYELLESLWHPEDAPAMVSIIEGYRANKADHHEIEMRLRTTTGEWRWMRCHGRMVLSWGEQSRPARLVSAVFDITERKQMEEQILRAHAELEARVEQRTEELSIANELLTQEIRQRQEAQQKLQESEARYRELVENANSIILEMDTDGRVTFFNRFAQEFYGFKEPEIIGRLVVGTIAPPVDSAGHDMKAQAALLVEHPEQYFMTENEGVRRSGERVWISWTNKGLYDAEGRLRNVLCIGMDRTEQRRVADMLAEQLKEKAAADERQRLARDLHDAVTQTLFSASLIAEVLPLLWEKDLAEGRSRLEELRRLTRGALAEMRMLLLEMRPASLGQVGLAELLRQLVEATTAQTRIRLTLRSRGTCGIPPEAQVALYRVAQEAVNNVVRHSAATEAVISLTCRQGSAELSVSDNGSGFDPKAVSPKSLGLRIMRERVEAVGATLKIQRRSGGGTKVGAAWSDARKRGVTS